MDDYASQAGRLLADRYRLPQSPAESHHLTESVAYDTASGQEVLVRQVPLPEVVEAEFVAEGEGPGGEAAGGGRFRGSVGRATRRPADPAVRRAVEAAVAAAGIPDHPRLDQVFDVFVEDEGLWIVSELLPATPLASLLEGQTLSAHRAAEIAADLLTALRAVHAHGWTHGNVTARTVLVCDDGRALLTGLAVGAAEEALCGYSPFPDSARTPLPPSGGIPGEPGHVSGSADAAGAAADGDGRTPALWAGSALPEGFDPRHEEAPRGIFGMRGPDAPDAPEGPDGPAAQPGSPVRHGYGTGGAPGARGARGVPGGAIAAYQAGTRRAAAARREQAEAAGSGAPEPTGGDHRPVPDDYVRWFTSGEDEISPADLPGARPANSLPVQASWRPARPGAGQEQEGGPGYEDVSEPYAEEDFSDEDLSEEDEHSRPWGEEASEEPGGPEQFRGPTTALAAERARQARMTVVGAVSERWAPEQAGPVHDHWRLAPPVGPGADLWALGVLLFRAVQGHAPYPEDDVAELVQMVCAEPPAFAEDCGPLRPVVESLMRQDPTERPEFEELRGWLRSLVRSAPEPEVGWHTVFAPSLETGGPSDPRRLPILRRRGELVRRRRAQRRAASAERQAAAEERRRQKRERPPKPPRERKQPRAGKPRKEKPDRSRRTQNGQRQRSSPRNLGRVLLGVVLAALTAVVLYAMWFMPEGGTDGSNQQRGAVPGASGPEESGGGEDGGGKDEGGDSSGGNSNSSNGGSEQKPQDPAPGAEVPKGYKLSRDPAGFQVAVPKEWNRRSTPGRGQVRYNGGEIEMVVVNGRDSVKKYGRDPMAYQSDDEPELAAYRASDWASTSGLRRIDVGETAMAEGTFSWRDGGRDVYVRNRAMILDGRYHVLMVMGSKSGKGRIDRHFEAVADTYRATRR